MTSKNLPQENSKNKDIALVLSSGGARGIAHIGVIEELEKLGYNITSVAGTSIGSVIGAFYACNELYTYKEWLFDLSKKDILMLMDFTFDSRGFINGRRLFRELKRIIPDRDIEDLNIPYSAIATDIMNRREVVIDSGSMYDAIRASIAIPGMLTPHIKGSAELYDGGLINPMPINRPIRKNGERIVAVDLNTWNPDYKPKKKEPNSRLHSRLDGFVKTWENFAENKLRRKRSNQKIGMLRLMSEMFDLMQEQISHYHVKETPPDLIIKIPRNACSTLDFHKSAEMIELGREKLYEALKESDF